MKLLFDENISYRILKKAESQFPGSKHISDFSRQRFKDSQIFELALKEGFCIVSYDEDFFEIQLLKGFPPKLIWLRFGNASTEKVATRLISVKDQLKDFEIDDILGVFELYI